MAKQKKWEYREKNSNRDGDGLKHRRLKDDTRWKFNPNAEYSSDDDSLDDEDWMYDSELDRR